MAEEVSTIPSEHVTATPRASPLPVLGHFRACPWSYLLGLSLGTQDTEKVAKSDRQESSTAPTLHANS
jgi:hypothetical protein